MLPLIIIGAIKAIAACEVTVNDSVINVTSVSLDKSEITLAAGSAEQFISN